MFQLQQLVSKATLSRDDSPANSASPEGYNIISAQELLGYGGENLTLKGCSLLLDHFHTQANFPGSHAKNLMFL